mmetsp:Transcript_35070/g.75997  ORF Transcript_35070/g.75997 Transcript_35070/m.75997 type:complete len:129 (+) Transcript_35070:17-403(+)
MIMATSAVMRSSPAARVLRGGRVAAARRSATTNAAAAAASLRFGKRPQEETPSAAAAALSPRPGHAWSLATRTRAASGAAGATEAKSPLYLALEDCEVFRVSDASQVKLTEMWKPDERAVVAFGRHFG